jgi:hypothetical protein
MINPIKGMIAVISNYGVGKTTFALECGYHPKDIVFVNDDVKETGFENDFKQYIDLVAVSKKKKLLDLHEYCLDLIHRLPKSKVVIWDTWTVFQNTFFQYVKTNEQEFRGPKEWAGKPSIKAGEWHNEAWRYEGAILSELKQKCDLLILTFHLKQAYLNNVEVPGKFKPGHDRAIEKYADLRIWLTPNASSQVPIGLVLKNISKREIVKNKGIRTSQVLPLRLPACNWDNILKYYAKPVGDREPAEDERPNSFELSLIEGTLTPEDKRLYEASLSLVEKQQVQEQAEVLMVKSTQEKAIKEYIQNNLGGLPGPLKLQKIQQAIASNELEYNNGEVTMAKVIEWSEDNG